MKSASIPKKNKSERIDALWTEVYILKQYFEALKLRDTIIGRCVLGLSVAWIVIDFSETPLWLELLPAFVFVMLLYWIAQNGYFATTAALFSMILENNFSPWLKNIEKIAEKDIKRIDEQRVLLTNYAAAAPKLSLLYFIHQNRVKKIKSHSYRFYAEHPYFKKALKIGFTRNIIAHFLPCEKYTEKKLHVMASIETTILEIKDRKKSNPALPPPR